MQAWGAIRLVLLQCGSSKCAWPNLQSGTVLCLLPALHRQNHLDFMYSKNQLDSMYSSLMFKMGRLAASSAKHAEDASKQTPERC